MIETDVALQLKETHQKIMQIMGGKLNEYGLTFGLLHLMMFIENNPDANQKEFAKKMRLTEGAMSIMVKRLLESSMIEQIPLESDMRYNRLINTQKGKSMIEDYKENLFKRYEEMFTGFDPEELLKLNDYLQRINNNLESIVPEDSFSICKK